VDGVFQVENLALDVDGDFAGKIAVGHGLGDVGDVADLAGQVRGHEVHGVGEVLPRAGGVTPIGLAAKLAFGAHSPGHAHYFRRERPVLVHHCVDRVLELEDLAADVDGDLLGEVAGGEGFGHFGDVAHLAGEVAGHEVHVVGEVFPR